MQETIHSFNKNRKVGNIRCFVGCGDIWEIIVREFMLKCPTWIVICPCREFRWVGVRDYLMVGADGHLDKIKQPASDETDCNFGGIDENRTHQG